MNFRVRVMAPLKGLAERIRAAALVGRKEDDGEAIVVGLPSTSAIRDPATIAAISRFEEARADET